MNRMDPSVAPLAPGTESDREIGSGFLWLCRTALIMIGGLALLAGLAVPVLFAVVWVLTFAATFSPYRRHAVSGAATVVAAVLFFILW